MPTSDAGPQANETFAFDAVRQAEWDEVQASRAVRLPGQPAARGNTPLVTDRHLTGLAFSGGGIRSATFNLGILQGLASLGLLPKFDYLSVVSGGGYIGNWLSAWIHRHPQGLAGVAAELQPKRAVPEDPHAGQTRLEAAPIRWLRDYSNYLTPRVGLLSGDTWSAVSTYGRNLLLNQSILVLGLAAFLLVPRATALLSASLTGLSGQALNWLLLISLALLVFSTALIGGNMAAFAAGVKAPGDARKLEPPVWMTPGGIIGFILVPLVLASWLLSCWMWRTPLTEPDSGYLHARQPVVFGVMLTSLLYFLPWALGQLLGVFRGRRRDRDPQRWTPGYALLVAAPFAGMLGGVLLWRVGVLIEGWRRTWHAGHHAQRGLFLVLTVGPSLILLVITLAAVLHIGLMGYRFQEDKREWWSRLGGFVIAAGLGWAGFFGIALYSPMLVMWLGGKVSLGALTAWVGTTLGGVLGGRSEKSGSPGSNRKLEIFLKVAPIVFLVGLLVVISFCSHLALARMQGRGQDVRAVIETLRLRAQATPENAQAQRPPAAVQPTVAQRAAPPTPSYEANYWNLVRSPRGRNILLALLFCAGMAALLAWRVDINEFSMHHFYRNRLVRCYLGASTVDRKQHPFTGFSPDDDLLLADLCTYQPKDLEKPGRDYEAAVTPYSGPYLLVNTALNIETGEKLAWQSRKATSFLISPRFCGYEVPPDDQAPGLSCHGFRRTRHYIFHKSGGIQAGTAMATSGAAASPNMGYHSSAPLAFLLTVFNVRLGRWIGNPRHGHCWEHPSPRWGLSYLCTELIGSANARRGYVYLSDGGHFENLGLYELVRRRCRYIVACDASADPQMNFEDLAGAIEKCRIDFGVPIEMDTTLLKPPAGSRISRRHYAIGRIRYDQAFDGEHEGVLVYLKASLTDNLPADLLHYMEANPAFPHTSTGDQFFDEAQFEGYRELGYQVAISAFGPLGAALQLAAQDAASVFSAISLRG
jgi:hypothetical protein